MNLIFGVGFTSEYVIRVITEKGLQNVSSVYLFSVWNTDEYRRKQAEEVINDISKYLDTLKVKYTVKYLDVNKEFSGIVLDIASSLTSTDNLEFYLIGGMRIVNLALYYYALVCKSLGKKVRVFSYTEDMSRKYEVLISFPAKVSESQLEIMRVLEKGEIEIGELAEKLKKSLSTVSKQISDLEEIGYVSCSETRPKRCKLTQLGEVLLKVL
mgnify:FL=1